MSGSGNEYRPSSLNRRLLGVGVSLWSIAMLGLLGWNLHQIDQGVRSQAGNQAEAALTTQSAIRRFVTHMGGIYVPIDKGVVPNEHLSHLEYRDIDTPVGTLTLVNSSYLVRLVDEIGNDGAELSVRAINDRPLSKRNLPDAWEASALRRLSPARLNWTQIVEEDGQRWLRELQGRIAMPECLSCHHDPGIEVGRLLGALSVRVPLQPLEERAHSSRLFAIGSYLGIWLLGLGVSIAAYRATGRWSRRREVMQRRLQDELAKEKTLSEMLRISQSSGELEEKLQKVIDLTTLSPLVDLIHRGAIFLDEPGAGRLRLAVERDLDPALKASCAQVEHGHCLCGRAAAERRLVFAACVDERHETRYQGMQEHGHYCVPIKSGERLLGVFTLYVRHGHEADEGEERFLTAIADILGNLIDRDDMTRKLRKRAFYDALTGLPNRALFLDRLRQRMLVETREGSSCSVMFIDLDGFKAVNDQMGHEQGDAVLKEAGQRIASAVRPQDTAARIGGDEFTVLLTEFDHRGQVEEIAQRLHQALAPPFLVDGAEFRLSASIGVAFSDQHHHDADELLSAADAAMYNAKQAGKSRTCVDHRGSGIGA